MPKEKPSVEPAGREGDFATFKASVGETEVARITVHAQTGAVKEMNSTGPSFDMRHLSRFSRLIQQQLGITASAGRRRARA